MELILLPESTRNSLPMALLRAREVVMLRFRPMLARHDITEQQWRVIRILSEESPLDASEVAERASILGPSLTRIIKTLQSRRLIKRGTFAGDGRRAQLAIAPAGKALIESLLPERSQIYDDLRKRHGGKELAELLNILDRLVERELADADSDCDPRPLAKSIPSP